MSKRKLTEQQLAQSVRQDYLARREARRSLEAQWQLNINFFLGNQYCYISPTGEIMESGKQYFWQEKEYCNTFCSSATNTAGCTYRAYARVSASESEGGSPC